MRENHEKNEFGATAGMFFFPKPKPKPKDRAKYEIFGRKLMGKPKNTKKMKKIRKS